MLVTQVNWVPFHHGMMCLRLHIEEMASIRVDGLQICWISSHIKPTLRHPTAYELGKISNSKKIACYDMLQLDLDMRGKMHEFWSLELQPLDSGGRIALKSTWEGED